MSCEYLVKPGFPNVDLSGSRQVHSLTKCCLVFGATEHNLRLDLLIGY